MSSPTYFLIPYSYSSYGRDYCNGGWYYALDAFSVPILVFFDPMVGTTTAHSKNPRVELCEVNPNGTIASWSLIDGSTNVMKCTQRIVHLANVSNSVTIAQVFTTKYGAFIEVQTRRNPSNSSELCMYVIWFNGWESIRSEHLEKLGAYTLGTKYTLTITAESSNRNSTIKFLYEPEGEPPISYALQSGASMSDMYFKSGAYVRVFSFVYILLNLYHY